MIENTFFFIFLLFFLTADNQTRVMIALSFFLFALVCLVHSNDHNDTYQGKSFGKLWVLSQTFRKFRSEVKWQGSFRSGPIGIIRTTSSSTFWPVEPLEPKFVAPFWQAGLLLVFSFTPFKIDQNKNQNRSIDKLQNLGKMEGKYAKTLTKIQVAAVSLMQDMRRNILPKFVEICTERPRWQPSDGHQQVGRKPTRNICHWVLLQNRKFISRGTQKHKNNTFSPMRELFRFNETSHFF